MGIPNIYVVFCFIKFGCVVVIIRNCNNNLIIIFHKGRYLSPCNKCNDPGNRLGLLPDPMGKMTLREPTKEDFGLWQKAVANGPLAKIKKREWE